jgi:hypothetical protein
VGSLVLTPTLVWLSGNRMESMDETKPFETTPQRQRLTASPPSLLDSEGGTLNLFTVEFSRMASARPLNLIIPQVEETHAKVLDLSFSRCNH